MTARRGALLLLMALPGCALLHPTGAPPPAAAPVLAAPLAAPEQSQQTAGLLEFVAKAGPGQSRTFEDPALGEVRVTAGRQYYSAAGLPCRHFVLAPLADGGRGSETRAVCRERDGWQLDPVGTTGAVRVGR